jgi:hypothetical protein
MAKRLRVDSAKIIGKPWKYTYRDGSHIDENYGSTSYRNLSIEIIANLPLSLEQDVMMHETIHAIDESLSLGLTESQVNVLGCVLAGIFRDNPHIPDYLKQT